MIGNRRNREENDYGFLSKYSMIIGMTLQVIPKKSLGQNFLNSERVVSRISETTEATIKDTILEIGPGLGALTEKFLELPGKVVAIEKDDQLFDILNEKFKNEIKKQKLTLINNDIIDFDPKTLKKIGVHDYIIAANIPYNITGLIIRKFLSEEFQPKKMILLIQSEVATRILARDNKESLLSISVKVYGTPKLVTKVARGNFNPVPRVDSAVIKIENISRKNFTNDQFEKKFFEIIHAGFAHKRKVLIKNILDAGLGNRALLEKIFSERKLTLTVRSEELTVDDWIFITNVLYNQ